MNKNSPVPLLTILTLAFAVGYAAVYPANEGLAFWFQTLKRPQWTIPTALFGPLWTIANGALGLSAWHCYRTAPSERGGRKVVAFGVVASTQVMVAVWSWCFFYWHLRLPTQLTAGLMLFGAIAMVAYVWRVNSKAGVLSLPYAAWAVYLAALGLQVFQLNVK